jgi:hypothetical protein
MTGGADRGTGGADRGTGGADRRTGGADRGTGGADRGTGGADRVTAVRRVSEPSRLRLCPAARLMLRPTVRALG